MIEYVSGTVAELTPTYAVVETCGVGYMMNITLFTYERLQGVTGTKLYVYEAIREDAHILYGFIDKAERDFFIQLIGVSGVGANTARMILSAYAPSELELIISSGDYKRLTSVKGIGGKTAQRIIVDLKDKIKTTGDLSFMEAGGESAESYDEALAALVMLGFAKPQSQKALDQIFRATPGIKVEAAIKQALTLL